MIKYGCLARFFNKYSNEVKFATENNFGFMQLWYDNKGLSFYKNDTIETIEKLKFPTIIHAVLDINEFEEHIPKLIKILKYLGHKEIIIHPICESEKITSKTNFKLSDKVKLAIENFQNEKILLYLENNSKLDPVFQSSEDIKYILYENPTLELLLDLAHIDNLNHLKELVNIKKPKILHLADRNLENIHEHLPIGEGNIDFEFIFNEILPNYEGRIIFEIIKSDKDVVNAKKIIDSMIKKSNI